MKTFQHTFKVFLSLLCLFLSEKSFAQNVGISSSNGFTPDASAGLDVSFTNKGLLIPRVALTATNAAGPIASPATALLVYNTATAGTSPTNVIPGYYYWNGTAWNMLSTTAQTATAAWSTTGNTGINYKTNFLGTTDNQSLRFRTNNTQRFLLDSLGNAAIGLSPIFSTNTEKLLVDAGTTTSFNVISGKGSINNYLQLNIQNNNAGTNASSDVVATADNGSESLNYVDMGINSSANTAAFFGSANDAYLYNAGGTVGGNLFIGTSTSGKVLGFMTGGGATTNERMRIDGAGNVGIGTTAPTTKLHVFGANPLTLSGVVTGTSTTADSLLTITSGLVRKLPISTFSSPASWSTTGNAGINYKTNFLGTTDNQSLRFRTNNTQRFLLDSLGNVAIGLAPVFTASPNAERLLVDAGSTSANPSTSYNVISGKGYLDNYLQLNIQNLSPTANASTDIVATADNGTESANFIDMGINSSANNSTGAIGGPGTAYIYGTGNDMAIGNGTANKSLIFFTGGTSPSTYTERIRLDASGRVGIGTNSPTSDLTLFQSSGTGGAKGVRLTGNSIGGTNSGSGFLFTLGYNASANKQIWFGDADGAGNSASTFLRIAASTSNFPTLDAVAGDNSTRRYLALGTAGDPNGGVLFGNSGTTTTPSSFVWDNGNMAIGSGYRGNTAPSNGLLVQGNVGIGTTSVNSTLTIGGSVTVPLTSASGSYTILATDHVIINTSTTTGTWTLPTASTCPGRIYRLVNQSTAAITLSPAVYTANATTTTSLNYTAGTNTMDVISDGTNWRQIGN